MTMTKEKINVGDHVRVADPKLGSNRVGTVVGKLIVNETWIHGFYVVMIGGEDNPNAFPVTVNEKDITVLKRIPDPEFAKMVPTPLSEAEVPATSGRWVIRDRVDDGVYTIKYPIERGSEVSPLDYDRFYGEYKRANIKAEEVFKADLVVAYRKEIEEIGLRPYHFAGLIAFIYANNPSYINTVDEIDNFIEYIRSAKGDKN